MSVEIIALTPHEITIKTDRGFTTITPEGNSARLITREQETSPISANFEIPLTHEDIVRVQNLRAKRAGVIYIVSRRVAEFLALTQPQRDDIYCVDRVRVDRETRRRYTTGLRRVTHGETT